MVCGPLAHGLFTGSLSEETTFPNEDWRSKSSVFAGETWRRNLTVVRELECFAASHAMTISQSAISLTLASPGVAVAISVSHAPTTSETPLRGRHHARRDRPEGNDSIVAAATPVAGRGAVPAPSG